MNQIQDFQHDILITFFAPASLVQDNIGVVTGFSGFKWQALLAWGLHAYVGFPVIPPFQFILSDIAEEATAPLVSLNSCCISLLLRAKGSKTLNLGPDLLRNVF